MTSTFLLVLTFVLASTIASAHERNYVPMFEDFKRKYRKTYLNDKRESHRMRVFVSNMKVAEKLNSTNPHASFGVNEFADWTAEEFASHHNAGPYYARELARRAKNAEKIAALDGEIKSGTLSSKRKLLQSQVVNWVDQGAVTYVKNQGQCGSCWSFSTSGNIEGQWAIAGNALVALTEQELVSCDTTNNGCGGGIMDNAFEWLISTQGGNIATEASYPYVSGGGQVPACQGAGSTGATITSYQDIPAAEASMSSWMSSGGPISIAVDATSWQTYTGGVMTDCVSQSLDHGVLAVGYNLNGNSQGIPYWIIKNSWGGSWGESGYIRVQYGTNQCLLASCPSSSVV